MSTINIFQISLEIWGCIISILVCMLFGTATLKNRDEIGIRLWTMILVNNILLACDALAYIYRGDATMLGTAMTRISNYGLFALEYVLLILYVGYIRYIVDESKGKRPLWVWICHGIVLIMACLLAITPFTGFYFRFDVSNHYIRSNGIAFSFIGCGLVIFLCMYQLWKCRKQFERERVKVFAACVLILLVCIVLQFLFYGLSLINIGLTIILLLLYVRRRMEQYRSEIDRAVKVVIDDARELAMEREADHAQNKE